MVPAVIAVEMLLRATLGTPSLFVLLGVKAVTAVLVFVAFLVTFRISGMSDVVAAVLADLAPRLHGPYVRIHQKLRGLEPGVDAHRDVA